MEKPEFSRQIAREAFIETSVADGVIDRLLSSYTHMARSRLIHLDQALAYGLNPELTYGDFKSDDLSDKLTRQGFNLRVQKHLSRLWDCCTPELQSCLAKADFLNFSGRSGGSQISLAADKMLSEGAMPAEIIDKLATNKSERTGLITRLGKMGYSWEDLNIGIASKLKALSKLEDIDEINHCMRSFAPKSWTGYTNNYPEQTDIVRLTRIAKQAGKPGTRSLNKTVEILQKNGVPIRIEVGSTEESKAYFIRQVDIGLVLDILNQTN